MSISKDKYKIKNWKAYNAALRTRGSVMLWLSEGFYRKWREIDATKKVVGEQLYPDVIIELCLTIGKVYDLPLRQTSGFIESVFLLMGLSALSVPDYSTLSRRGSSIEIKISHRPKGQLDIAADSTGLKLYGEGEWKVRKHGVSKRRTWRKLHLAVDVCSQEIVSVALTDNSIDDAAMTEELLKPHQGKIKNFYGDGAYDRRKARKAVHRVGGKVIVPPQKNAVKSNSSKPEFQERNQAIERIEEVGRSEWKKQVGYHKRSLSEVAMFRYKGIIGSSLSARKFDNQISEVKIGCHILNVFRACGMPKAVKLN